MTDHRSPAAQAWRRLYKTKPWVNGRTVFLAQHPLCERCQANGHVTTASVVNHRTPHKGDLTLFFDWSNWQALCAPCHDRDVQGEEARGFSTAIGRDGWPIDPRHRANRR